MKITLLDLFSGAGGFHLGLEKVGFEVDAYFSEIDKHAVAVYKHKFKQAKYVGSVTDVRGADLPRIDILTMGSPCQSFSLAGKRKGLEGKSGLIREGIRLIEECRPKVFIWENVKGTFSSNGGRDFAAVLKAFSATGLYTIEWELQNTKSYLPQNRERIYLVGYIGGGSRPKIFPLPENDKISTKRNNEQPSAQLAVTITSREGVVKASNYVKIKSNTKKGYEVANEAVIVAMRGRNPDNPSDRTTGSPTEQRLEINQNGTANTLTSVQKDNLVMTDRIRRLTPVECERLQGFSDNWTAFGNYDGEVKPISDTQRYKLMGNAVTVDVVAAVATQIKKVINPIG